MSQDQWNYLFVSDMHVAEGFDQTIQAYSPREDFLYDAEFSNFLHYMNVHRETNGRPWELVIVGDGLDFLPVEIGSWKKFKASVIKLMGALFINQESEQNCRLSTFMINPIIPDSVRMLILKDLLQRRLLVTEIGEHIEYPRDPCVEEGAQVYLRDHELAFLYSKDEIEKIQRNNQGIILKFNRAGGLGLFLQKQWMKFVVSGNNYFAGNLWTEFEQYMMTEDGARLKFKKISEGHPRLFEAFAWWVTHGNRLVVIAGNHDLELRWPKVQEDFTDKLIEIIQEHPEWDRIGTQEDCKRRIDLRYTWFYHQPGLFYAEHGDQYDALNSAQNAIRPFEPDWGAGQRAFLPYGSLGVWMLVGRLEDEFPQFEIMGDQADAIRFYLNKYPFKTLKLLAENSWQYSRIAWRSLFSPLGPTPGTRVVRFIQFSVVDFLFWLRKGLWRQLAFFVWPLRTWIETAKWTHYLDEKSDPNDWIKSFPPPVEYYPSSPLREKLCNWVGIDPAVAEKVYASWYPTDSDFKEYAEKTKLSPEFIKRLYATWDQPAAMRRIPMSIYLFFFSIIGALLNLVNILAKSLLWLLKPMGGLFPVGIILAVFLAKYPQDNKNLVALWTLITEYINGLIDQLPILVSKIIPGKDQDSFLVTILGLIILMLATGFKEMIKRIREGYGIKFFNYFVDSEDYILEGVMGIRRTFQQFNRLNLNSANNQDANLSGGSFDNGSPLFYIMGHDHRPSVKKLEPIPDPNEINFGGDRNDYYYNTGSWLPWFADQDLRRMRTGGLDNEFTFLSLSATVTNEWENYQAKFLRWNDDANRPVDQVEIHTSEETPRGRLFGGWIAIGITAGAVSYLLTHTSIGNGYNFLGFMGAGAVAGWLVERILEWLDKKIFPWKAY